MPKSYALNFSAPANKTGLREFLKDLSELSSTPDQRAVIEGLKIYAANGHDANGNMVQGKVWTIKNGVFYQNNEAVSLGALIQEIGQHREFGFEHTDRTVCTAFQKALAESAYGFEQKGTILTHNAAPAAAPPAPPQSVPTGDRTIQTMFKVEDARKAIERKTFGTLLTHLAQATLENSDYAKKFEGITFFAQTSDGTQQECWSVHQGKIYDNRTGKVLPGDNIADQVEDLLQAVEGKISGTTPATWGSFGFAHADQKILTQYMDLMFGAVETVKKPFTADGSSYVTGLVYEAPFAKAGSAPKAEVATAPITPFTEYELGKTADIYSANFKAALNTIMAASKGSQEAKAFEIVVHASNDATGNIQSWTVKDGQLFKKGDDVNPVTPDSVINAIGSYKNTGVYGLRAESTFTGDMVTALQNSLGLSFQQIKAGIKNYGADSPQAALPDVAIEIGITSDAPAQAARFVRKADIAADKAHVKGQRAVHLKDMHDKVHAGRQPVKELTLAEAQKTLDAGLADTAPAVPKQRHAHATMG